ncbi:WecE Predicted pyridoxal phosphate-dependent enzyme apparently involved in regulation of cell wall biogenesis [Caulobacteraceae bacterium]
MRGALMESTLEFIRSVYGEGFVPLHRPAFEGHEAKYVSETIDTNFVSSVGQRVVDFEDCISGFTGARHAVAIVNGTSALHMALMIAGVSRGDEVLTQALTFVATCNALSYIGAQPVFLDVDRDTMGLSPDAVRNWLKTNAIQREGAAFNRTTGARISACVPMHTFGMPARIQALVDVCDEFGIPVVEDAAESLGSYVGDIHTGRFGKLGVISFNGNKIVTTGGGGMIITDDLDLAKRAKHLSTTAKKPHAWEYDHDEIGYNYRMPNLNAALGVAQMERLPAMLEIKAEVAAAYAAFCEKAGLEFVGTPAGTRPNYWLNAILLSSLEERNEFLAASNSVGIMTRPVWKLMTHLTMFRDCQRDALANSLWLEERLVNIPSSVPDKDFRRLRQ